MYAILDIEITGGKFNEEGITEIAIYKFDGHTVIDQFISLINPEKPIQEFVVKLTGINNKMLRNAPKFFEVAKRIIEITKDSILVAHNAEFDTRILKTEFDRLGYEYQRNSICTVELSRKLIQDEKSYSLGKLCKSLGIPMSDRHRATGDALATVQLFKLLLDKDHKKEIVQNSIKYFDNRNVKDKLNSILEIAISKIEFNLSFTFLLSKYLIEFCTISFLWSLSNNNLNNWTVASASPVALCLSLIGIPKDLHSFPKL